MKKRLGILFIAAAVFFGSALVVLGIYHIYREFTLYAWKLYETTDIDQYGDFYPGVYGYDPTPCTDRVMPERIEPFFRVVRYSYRICHTPDMHEAYLEIVIEDEAQYDEYVSVITQGEALTEFSHDPSFRQYVIEEDISVSHFDDKHLVTKSRVLKILVCDETNTVVFVSLDVPKSDMPLESEFFYYFERFNIDVTKDIACGEKGQLY